MEKHRNKFFTTFLIAGTLFIAGLAISARSRVEREVPLRSSLASEDVQVKAIKEEKAVIFSPDGKYTLTVYNASQTNGVLLQTFSVFSEEDKTPVKIFEKESNAQNLVSVPPNTFSPDNKYIFLRYEDSGKSRYIVLRTDAKDIKEGSKLIEIETLFAEKQSNFVITDVTGWGSYSLIVINTDTKDGKKGPSWWFDLSNFSFIRLSSRFN